MYISTEIAKRSPMDVGAPPVPFNGYCFYLVRTVYQPAQRSSRWLRWL